MTDTKLKEKFIEILKFNMLEPTIDPEDGNFEDHLSIQLWKFFTDELAIARAEERERVVGELEYGQPLSTFVQWKGTDLCMDWFCEDGHQNHCDGYSAYEIECETCNKKYYPKSSVVLNKEKPDFMKDEG